jgi:secreted PhoX family phosphatase
MVASRITEYTPPFSNGMAASVVIGQTNLDNTYLCNGVSSWAPNEPPAPTAATLCSPSAATFDAQGDLWVADAGNNRVLEYVPPFTTGMAASLQIGYSALIYEMGCGDDGGGPDPNITASTFCSPQAVAFDSKGNLWVSDGYNRVLEFLPPFSNGMAASLVIGASTFTQPPQYAELPATANLLNGPYGMVFDSNGNLVLSDGGNSRVLTFVSPFNNGMSATEVTGEQNMSATSRGAGCAPASANTLCWSDGGVLSF